MLLADIVLPVALLLTSEKLDAGSGFRFGSIRTAFCAKAEEPRKGTSTAISTSRVRHKSEAFMITVSLMKCMGPKDVAKRGA